MTTAEKERTRVAQPDAKDVLRTALRDNLSPEAVAAIAAHLGSVQTNSKSVNGEAAWFRGFLVDLLGVEQVNAMCEELGL